MLTYNQSKSVIHKCLKSIQDKSCPQLFYVGMEEFSVKTFSYVGKLLYIDVESKASGGYWTYVVSFETKTYWVFEESLTYLLPVESLIVLRELLKKEDIVISTNIILSEDDEGW